jgi:hypothetical protein
VAVVLSAVESAGEGMGTGASRISASMMNLVIGSPVPSPAGSLGIAFWSRTEHAVNVRTTARVTAVSAPVLPSMSSSYASVQSASTIAWLSRRWAESSLGLLYFADARTPVPSMIGRV